MDSAYVTWGIVAVIGAVLGLFLKPRTILVATAVLFGAAIFAIFLAYGNGNEKLGFMFGVAAMAILILGSVGAGGAALMRAICKRNEPG